MGTDLPLGSPAGELAQVATEGLKTIRMLLYINTFRK